MGAENVTYLHTEQRNPDTVGIADASTLDMLTLFNDEDRKVADAVRAALPKVAEAVDLIAGRMQRGGRLIYVGAGTSGRLGYMDAAECAPTYGMPYDSVACVMAGGHEAVFRPHESLEDLPGQAEEDLAAFGLTDKDTVVAAAASGRTPYCVGALDYAQRIGAGAVSIACNPGAVMSGHAQVAIEVDTGAEAIMGSTRMKAGTAQKMVMNMLSTGVMVKLGRTCDNLMICMRANNEKVSNRAVRLFNEATGCTGQEPATGLLRQASGRVDIAVLMYKTGATLEQAERAAAAHTDFRQMLRALSDAGKQD